MAEPTVNVVFPDGSGGPIPASQRAAALKAGAKMVAPALSGGQKAAKFFADMAPGLGGFTGSLIGGGAGGIASAPVGGELSIPGAMAGGAIGGALGTGVQRQLYSAAGLPMDDRLLSLLRHVGLNAAGEGLSAGLGGGADIALQGLRGPTMKAAIGNAFPGTQDILVKEGIVPDAAGLARSAALKERAGAASSQAAAAAEQAGVSFPRGFQYIERNLRRLLGRTSSRDILGTSSESSVEGSLSTARQKIGPKVTTTPASKVLNTSGQPAIPASTTITPPAPMTATQLDGIYKQANEEVRKLMEARISKNNRSTVPDANEKAWMSVRDAAGNMLNKRVPGFAKANADYVKFTRAYDAIFAAMKRSPRLGATGLAGAVGAVPAAMTHDPAMLAFSPAAALLTHYAQSPATLGGIAAHLGSPAVRAGVRSLPTAAETLFLRGLLGVGAPPDATSSPGQ